MSTQKSSAQQLATPIETNDWIPICPKHNWPVIQCNLQQKQFYCQKCLEENFQFQSIDSEKEILETESQILNANVAKITQKLYQETEYLYKVTQKIEVYRQKIIEISSQLNLLEYFFSPDQLSQFLMNLDKFEEKKILTNSLIQEAEKLSARKMLKELIETLEGPSQSDRDENESKENNWIMNYYIKALELSREYDSGIFQIIQNMPCKKNQGFKAIAFNNDSSLMIIGCDKIIKVFSYEKDYFAEWFYEKQEINYHQGDVTCLKFMKKTKQFISASDDTTIIIWRQNNHKLWVNLRILKKHNKCINCLELNDKENLLMSGSNDNTINFWSFQYNDWYIEQTINCYSSVYSLSINQNQDKLIAAIHDKQILILENVQYSNQWKISKRIQVDQYGYRLKFISNKQFVFQPSNSNEMHVYKDKENNNTFKRVDQGAIKFVERQKYDDLPLFPICFNQDKLLVKYWDEIILMNTKFKIIERIRTFANGISYGCMSEDSQFIAIWDSDSQYIKIRKIKCNTFQIEE